MRHHHHPLLMQRNLFCTYTYARSYSRTAEGSNYKSCMDIQYVSPQLTPNHYENQEGEHQTIMKKLLLNFRDLIIIFNIKFRMIKELGFFSNNISY